MFKKSMLGAGLAVFGAVTLAPTAGHGQDQNPTTEGPTATDTTLAGATLRLQVDGMVCPFCAYGLEKRLRELAAIDAVVVRISDGVVLIREHAGHELAREELSSEIEKAGFSLREMTRLDP